MLSGRHPPYHAGVDLRDLARDLRDDAAAWADGRSPWVRAPLLGYLTYAGVRHTLDPMYRSWFAGLTLVLHEMGHLLFSPLGQTLMLLGGSIFQLLCPFAAAVYLLLRQHDWFGFGVGASWLAFSTWELATYVDDANQGNLPLVGMGDDVLHDWDTLLTQWHLLNHAQTFATALRGLAFLEWALATLLSGWLLLRMWRSPASAPTG